MELFEVLLESDQVQVEHVDAVAEVLESELCPDLAELFDGPFASGLAEFVPVCFAKWGGVADGGPGTAGQFPDCDSGEKGAKTEAAPMRSQSYVP
jgi:hypothetical protein